MKKTEYNKAVSFIRKCFPNNNIPPDTFKIWYDTVFINMDYELFLFRLADCVEECSYIPMPTYFCNNQEYVFYFNNRNVFPERLTKRFNTIKKAVEK